MTRTKICILCRFRLVLSHPLSIRNHVIHRVETSCVDRETLNSEWGCESLSFFFFYLHLYSATYTKVKKRFRHSGLRLKTGYG